MKLTKISLINFRNYSNVNVSFNDKMNVLIGNNAQGKTNILEAITILALTKSNRVGVSPNLIKFGKKKSIIRGVVKKDRIISKLEVEIKDNMKNIKLNQTEVRRISDYISNLNVIVFIPDDLEIIKGSPNIRRNLLNIQLSQLSKAYLNTYNEYNKILKTRNEYLKVLFSNSIADKEYLDILTDKLIEKAVIIYQMRSQYLKLVNSNINRYFSTISGLDGLEIVYMPNIDFASFEYFEIKSIMLEKFRRNYSKELNYGMTMYGPHRDEFYFNLDGNDLKFFGSQGQQKIAILAFKLSEISIFKEFQKTSPVLLLDDVFGELDIKKRNRILKLINSEDVQSIITTTDIRNINKKYLEDAYIYEVVEGSLERK